MSPQQQVTMQLLIRVKPSVHQRLVHMGAENETCKIPDGLPNAPINIAFSDVG
jgi:hypothetical protein